MAKDKKKLSEVELEKAGIYKGYSINWLRKLGVEHPDYHLVAEYDRKYGKGK